jgi:hypothetical protein
MMKLTPQFHLLVEKIDAVQPGDDLAVDILKLIAESYGMTHVAYLGLQLPVAEQRLPLGYVTYPKSWIERYVSKEYVKADPVVAASLKSILPTDWSSIKLKSKSQIQIFGEAKEFGIGTQGITFPIRGRGGEKALFSVVGNMSEREWDSFKSIYPLPCHGAQSLNPCAHGTD